MLAIYILVSETVSVAITVRKIPQKISFKSTKRHLKWNSKLCVSLLVIPYLIPRISHSSPLESVHKSLLSVTTVKRRTLKQRDIKIISWWVIFFLFIFCFCLHVPSRIVHCEYVPLSASYSAASVKYPEHTSHVSTHQKIMKSGWLLEMFDN